jgi:HAD superfamily hydrolase (TIGR01509 family)
MVDAALIELEGVLFDTGELRRAALASTQPTDADDPVLVDLAAMRAERAFSDALAARGVRLNDGARDFVREASAVARLVAVTRAKRSDASTLLRLGGIEEFFSIVITADDVSSGKPSAECIHVALERLARQRPIDASAVVALEDSAAGIRAARSAGVRCIAVGDVPAHVAMEADAYVESLSGHTIRSLDLLSSAGGGQEHVK